MPGAAGIALVRFSESRLHLVTLASGVPARERRPIGASLAQDSPPYWAGALRLSPEKVQSTHTRWVPPRRWLQVQQHPLRCAVCARKKWSETATHPFLSLLSFLASAFLTSWAMAFDCCWETIRSSKSPNIIGESREFYRYRTRCVGGFVSVAFTQLLLRLLTRKGFLFPAVPGHTLCLRRGSEACSSGSIGWFVPQSSLRYSYVGLYQRRLALKRMLLLLVLS